jgi:hypothetical protein
VNASRLLHIVQNPDSIDAQTALELQAMASDLPWFATPRTLLARYYKSKNDYRETDSLHHAALRMADRRWLYHFLNSPTAHTTAAPSPQNPDNSLEKAADAATSLQAPPVSEPRDTAANLLAAAASKPSDTALSSSLSFEPVSNQEPQTWEETESPADTPLDDRFLRAEPSRLSFSPVQDEIPEAKVEYQIEDHFDHEETQEEPRDFFAWLSQSQPEENTEPEPSAPKTSANEPAHSAPTADISSKSSHEAASMTESGPADAPVLLDAKARQALIDKFIASNPSISRPKKEFYNPETAMKRAEEFDPSLCSETLAGLFRKQSAFEKALACYRRLQLKFPEKSAYFAALITEVENEKRNAES